MLYTGEAMVRDGKKRAREDVTSTKDGKAKEGERRRHLTKEQQKAKKALALYEDMYGFDVISSDDVISSRTASNHPEGDSFSHASD